MNPCGFESVSSARAAGASLAATGCERTGRGTWLPCTRGPLAGATPSARARVKPSNFMGPFLLRQRRSKYRNRNVLLRDGNPAALPEGKSQKVKGKRTDSPALL